MSGDEDNAGERIAVAVESLASTVERRSAAPAQSDRAAELAAKARQFELYVTMAEAVTDRQAVLMRFYVGLNTALIGGGGYAVLALLDESAGDQRLTAWLPLACFVVCSLGTLFSLLWLLDHMSHNRWKQRKYEIVRRYEEAEAAFHPLYSEEWDLAKSSALGWLYRRVPPLPLIFAIVYSVGALVTLDVGCDIETAPVGLFDRLCDLGGWGEEAAAGAADPG